ncbi:hypothetical protein KNO81_23565 [Paraburkholderia sediminicola]|nr:hypothetical protein [Paraburkholderia sediminicola]
MYQRAVGDATTASIAPDTFDAGGSFAPDASTSRNQLLVRPGMLHKFEFETERCNAKCLRGAWMWGCESKPAGVKRDFQTRFLRRSTQNECA